MTRAEQDVHWYKYNHFRLYKTKQHKPAIYAALQAQLQHFADTQNIETIPLQPVYDAIKELYINVGPLWAHQSYLSVMRQVGERKSVEVKTRMPIGYNQQFIQKILEYFRTELLNHAVIKITATTKEFIREILSKGAEQGFDINEIIKEIMTSGISRRRAETIARTEVGKAANAGEQIGIDKTGLQTLKIWLSVRDKRTRFDHVEADEQTVPDGKPFIVGGYLMQRPMVSITDDGLSVPGKEVINCRCTMGRKVLRGADGLPLSKN